MKVAAFITVRLGSTRLPNKALLEIKGTPTIVHLIERIKHAHHLDEIVLCTTENLEDKKLLELAESVAIKSFAGDEKDIIKRHYDAAIHFGLDFVVNVDGDDLFCDPDYINEIVEIVKKSKGAYDVIQTKGLPFGVNSFGYQVDCLKQVLENKKEDDTDTGWGEFFRENKGLNTLIINAKERHIVEDKKMEPRMSLDYQEDFEFFKKIIESLYNEGNYFSYDDIMKYLKENPDIVKINKNIEEKYWENYDNKKVIK